MSAAPGMGLPVHRRVAEGAEGGAGVERGAGHGRDPIHRKHTEKHRIGEVGGSAKRLVALSRASLRQMGRSSGWRRGEAGGAGGARQAERPRGPTWAAAQLSPDKTSGDIDNSRGFVIMHA